ncbi:MAG: DUF4097 family beta strand repeat protein [Planctomycetes bacterium]|nr:DUF4097 family beta strand repeat protein [Planctomycetota bacterium]
MKRMCLFACLSLAAAGCATYEFEERISIERTLEDSGFGRVSIENPNGPVYVQGGATRAIAIRATKVGFGRTPEEAQATAEAIEIAAAVEDGAARIEGILPDSGAGRRSRVEFEIDVPHDRGLRVHAGNGAIRVADLSAQGDLQAGNGSIETRAVTGSLRARTDNGSITIEAQVGPVVASTGNGGIRLSGRMAEIDLDTGNGAIDAVIDGDELGGRMHAGNGAIDVVIEPSCATLIDARSGNGRVRCAVPLQDARIDGTHVRGRIGGAGAHELRLDTGNGGITIRPQNAE